MLHDELRRLCVRAVAVKRAFDAVHNHCCPAAHTTLTLQDAARKGQGKLTADVQMYAVTAEEVAQAKGVNYVDMYNAIMSVKNWDVSS